MLQLASKPRGTGNRMKVALIAWSLVVAVVLSGLGFSIGRDYQFGLNETESLPNWGFLVNKTIKVPHRGDYFAFVAPPNPYYPAGQVFTKHVVGVPGDVVTVKGRDFYVNGVFIGTAKTHSKTGAVAVMSDPGVIPAGHYFMNTPHPDSLDSRYKMIGLIGTERLVGKAEPVM